MIQELLAEPTDEVRQLIEQEALYIKPTVDSLLVDFSEDKKAQFVEDLMVGLTKAFKKRSRIPLRHRLSTAAIRCVVDYLGRVPPKKTMTPELTEHAKAFSDKLITICQADKMCKRYL